MNYVIIMLWFLFLFISGLIVFLNNFKYLLINLLSIEYMMLMLLTNLYLIFNFLKMDLFFILMFLTFMVTEGVLGICILISMIRNFGNNNFMNLLLLSF